MRFPFSECLVLLVLLSTPLKCVQAASQANSSQASLGSRVATVHYFLCVSTIPGFFQDFQGSPSSLPASLIFPSQN
jgi:hypothetical protein